MREDIEQVKASLAIVEFQRDCFSGNLERTRAELWAAQDEIEHLRSQLALVHQHVDQTDPFCPVGTALTKAGCTMPPQTKCNCFHSAGDSENCVVHPTCSKCQQLLGEWSPERGSLVWSHGVVCPSCGP